MKLVVRTYPVGVPGVEFVHQIPRGSEWLSTRADLFDNDVRRWRAVMAWLVDETAEVEEKWFVVVPEDEVLTFTPGACRGSYEHLHVFEVIR